MDLNKNTKEIAEVTEVTEVKSLRKWGFTGIGVVLVAISLTLAYTGGVFQRKELKCDSDQAKMYFNELAYERGFVITEMGGFKNLKSSHNENVCSMLYKTNNSNEVMYIEYKLYQTDDDRVALITGQHNQTDQF